jgi:hypothetical protein
MLVENNRSSNNTVMILHSVSAISHKLFTYHQKTHSCGATTGTRRQVQS